MVETLSLGRTYAEFEINFSEIRGKMESIVVKDSASELFFFFKPSLTIHLGIEKIEMLILMNRDMALNQECHLILKGKNKYNSTSQSPFCWIQYSSLRKHFER